MAIDQEGGVLGRARSEERRKKNPYKFISFFLISSIFYLVKRKQ
jgi:hypothetical protein